MKKMLFLIVFPDQIDTAEQHALLTNVQGKN